MTIVSVSDYPHNVESQSHRNEVWLDGYIEVPKNLESAMWSTLGWCDLQIEGGVLVGIIPKERPELGPESYVPTTDERLSALESAMLSMMGVSTDV